MTKADERAEPEALRLLNRATQDLTDAINAYAKAREEEAYARGHIAGFNEARDRAVKIVADDTRVECPFDGRTDLLPEDPCPVCGGLGTTDAEDKCHSFSKHRIRDALSALKAEEAGS